MDQVTPQDTAENYQPVATGHIHPNMPPEERVALWRSVRARWKRDRDEMRAWVRDLEKERDEWDERIP